MKNKLASPITQLMLGIHSSQTGLYKRAEGGVVAGEKRFGRKLTTTLGGAAAGSVLGALGGAAAGALLRRPGARRLGSVIGSTMGGVHGYLAGRDIDRAIASGKPTNQSHHPVLQTLGGVSLGGLIPLPGVGHVLGGALGYRGSQKDRRALEALGKPKAAVGDVQKVAKYTARMARGMRKAAYAISEDVPPAEFKVIPDSPGQFALQKGVQLLGGVGGAALAHVINKRKPGGTLVEGFARGAIGTMLGLAGGHVLGTALAGEPRGEEVTDEAQRRAHYLTELYSQKALEASRLDQVTALGYELDRRLGGPDQLSGFRRFKYEGLPAGSTEDGQKVAYTTSPPWHLDGIPDEPPGSFRPTDYTPGQLARIDQLSRLGGVLGGLGAGVVAGRHAAKNPRIGPVGGILTGLLVGGVAAPVAGATTGMVAAAATTPKELPEALRRKAYLTEAYQERLSRDIGRLTMIRQERLSRRLDEMMKLQSEKQDLEDRATFSAALTKK